MRGRKVAIAIGLSALLVVVCAFSIWEARYPRVGVEATDVPYNRGPISPQPPAPTIPTHTGPAYTLEFTSPSEKSTVILQGSDRRGPVEFKDYKVGYRQGEGATAMTDWVTIFDASSSEVYRNPVKWLSDSVAVVPLMKPGEYPKLHRIDLQTGASTDLDLPLTKVFAYRISPDGTKIAVRGARESSTSITVNILVYDVTSQSSADIYQYSSISTGPPMDGLSWRHNGELYFDIDQAEVPAIMRWSASDNRVEVFLDQALNPQVSPNGDLIAYLSAPSVYADPPPRGIVVRSFDGAVNQGIAKAIGTIVWSDGSEALAITLRDTVWAHQIQPLPAGATREIKLPSSVSRAEYKNGKLHLQLWKILDGDIIGTEEVIK